MASDCLVRCFCCCLCREREKNTPRIAFRFPWRTSSAWTPSTLTPSSRRQARHALMLSICRKNGHYWRSCALNYREQAEIWGTHAHKPEPSPLATCPYRRLKCILYRVLCSLHTSTALMRMNCSYQYTTAELTTLHYMTSHISFKNPNGAEKSPNDPGGSSISALTYIPWSLGFHPR